MAEDWWDLMVDTQTGETVPVIKVGIDRATDSSRNMIVWGTETTEGGTEVLKADIVHPGRTVPLNGNISE